MDWRHRKHVFVKDMVYPERLTTSGIRDTNGKG